MAELAQAQQQARQAGTALGGRTTPLPPPRQLIRRGPDLQVSEMFGGLTTTRH